MRSATQLNYLHTHEQTHAESCTLNNISTLHPVFFFSQSPTLKTQSLTIAHPFPSRRNLPDKIATHRPGQTAFGKFRIYAMIRRRNLFRPQSVSIYREGVIKMALEILTFGEALVEVMRTEIDQPLDQPGPFIGPFPSGAPFIFAVQAARLGATTAAVGSVGDDAFGRCLIDQLRLDGVEIQGVRILPTHTTGVAFVAYNADGSRHFVFHIAQSAAGQLSPDMLDDSLFAGLGCLHLMGSTLSIHQEALKTGLRALNMAQAAGAKISFDPNLRPELMPPATAREVFRPIIDAADLLIPTAEELLILTGQTEISAAVNLLLEDHPDRIIIITQGAKGCQVITQAGSEQIAGFKVDEIDPTGAGDCFDAGFLVQWLAGAEPAKAARFANACGALAVTARGPMAGAYDLDAVQRFMEDETSR
jgi:tagatose kinase